MGQTDTSGIVRCGQAVRQPFEPRACRILPANSSSARPSPTRRTMPRRIHLSILVFVVLITGLAGARAGFERIAAAERQGSLQAPRFEVDPLWPKPLPNHWVLGQTIGVAVGADDHVWVVHRGDATLNIMTEGNNTKGPVWTVTSDQP